MGGATFRKTPISWFALYKNPMPGHLFECNPMDEITTQRGTDTPVHCLEKPADSKYNSTSGLSPRKQLDRQVEFHASTQTRPDSAGASWQSRSGPKNVHGVAEKENYSKRLQQRWGREVQTCLHKGKPSDTSFIQHLIFTQESVRKTRQLTFFLVDLYVLQKVTRSCTDHVTERR